MKFKTFAQAKRALDGKRVLRTVEGVNTIEDWPKIKEELALLANLQGFELRQEDEGRTLAVFKEGIPTGQYFRRPVQRKYAEGVFKVRSGANYEFITPEHHLQGDAKASEVELVEGGFKRIYDEGFKITYTLLEDRE